MNLSEEFEKHDDEFLKFERIKKPLHARPDICAMLMIHAIVGGVGDLISAAEHDVFYFDVDVETFAEKATTEQIRDLRRCGVVFFEECDSLGMFT